MRSSKIVVHLSGGLGNQMFQFMAGYGIAEATNKDLLLNFNWFENPKFLQRNSAAYLTKRKIDIIQFKNVANTLVDSSLTPRDGRFERFLGQVSESRRRSFGIASEESFKNGKWVDEASIRRLNGFFMSPKFFLNSQPEKVFHDLSTPLSSWALEMSRRISETPSIGVHIRLGDYVVLGDKVIPVENYFLQGVSYLHLEMGAKAEVFLFTDEPAKLASLFPKLSEMGTIISPPNDSTSAENMILLSKCASFVCSNSTFSWWGAQLSATPKSLVVRPSYFYTAQPNNDVHYDLWSSDSKRIHPISGEIL